MKKHTYDYPLPAVTVDMVIFTIRNGRLMVLLIKRRDEPHQGCWAIPGGFVDVGVGHVPEGDQGEDLDAAAERELLEETSLRRERDDVFLEQLYTFGALGRDPRERVVSVAYYALVKLSDHKVRAATDAADAAWFAISDLPELAFDHDEIFELALQRLRNKVRYQPIGFELLPKKFTLTQLQRMYEIILERRLDKRNFRKKILGMDLLVELDEVQKDVAHRAARLYKFDDRRYRKLVKQGFSFEI